MRWRNTRRSTNVEDRRHTRMGTSRGKRGIGVRGGLLGIILAIGAIYMGVDPRIVMSVLSGGNSGSSVSTQSYTPTTKENEYADFTSAVLATTEDVWSSIFPQTLGQQYREPQLVLFKGGVRSGCGMASSAMGPFYCPMDSKMYIDLGFFEDLQRRHDAPGDFAQAYVIAHEVGHHVQNLMGTSNKVHAARQRVSTVEGNRLSVKQELQADCYAGIWAHHVNKKQKLLEAGDLQEALNAAIQIGDDTLQRKARGHVVEASFTHGTGAQRKAWLERGFKSGRLADCNTF